MLTREQAYKDYLDKYRVEIDNMINKANEKHRLYTTIDKETPKEIIEELKETGYIVETFLPEQFEIPKPFGGKEKIQLPEAYKISWGENK